MDVKFFIGIEENYEIILEVIKDEFSVPHKRVKLKCAEIKPDVKFENLYDSYVKFCPGIEKNGEELIQDEVSVSHKGMKNPMVRYLIHHTVYTILKIYIILNLLLIFQLYCCFREMF